MRVFPLEAAPLLAMCAALSLTASLLLWSGGAVDPLPCYPSGTFRHRGGERLRAHGSQVCDVLDVGRATIP